MSRVYFWSGINNQGSMESGKLHKSSKKEAIGCLEENNVTVVSIKEEKTFSFFAKGGKVKNQDMLHFTRQLYQLLDAGVSLLLALQTILSGLANKKLKLIVSKIIEDVSQGSSFHKALAIHSQYFNHLYCAFVKTGEASGSLAENLCHLYHYQKKQEKVKQQLLKAISYPATVLFLGVCLSLALFTFVIPQFNDIYEKSGGKLPTLTQHLISLSHFIINHGPMAFVIAVACVFFFCFLRKVSERFAVLLSRAALLFPLFGNLIRRNLVANWAALLGCCQQSGVPIDKALVFARHSAQHKVFDRILERLNSRVTSGSSLYEAMQEACFFDAVTKQMILVGEHSAKLDTMLGSIAQLQSQQLGDALNSLSKWLEPVMIVVLAGLLGTVIIGMYLPIFNMGSII